MRRSFLLGTGFLLAAALSCRGSVYFPRNVVPIPSEVEARDGAFRLDDSTVVYSAVAPTESSVGLLTRELGLRVVPSGAPAGPAAGNTVSLSVDPQVVPDPEGYVLTVGPAAITVTGHDSAGLFYGCQTLLQAIPAGFRSQPLASIPAVVIRDHPRFSWRGMHLDVARHFFPKERILEFIDELARYKFNTFHWHLSDDQGWRIEIKKYPRLTEVGAWRDDTRDRPWDYRQHPVVKGKPVYGGFYTQEEIREIVRYAASRHITIVPEIDVPGHSWAALLAYPRLSCSGQPFFVPDDVPFAFTDPFCAGNEETYTFLQDVFGEIMDLFPSEYIHLGGDEAKKTPWEHCPKCQATIRREGLHGAEELQSYFIRRIGAFINRRGRKYIGWDEIREGGLPAGAAVMSWRGEKGGIDAVKAGQSAVMAPGEYLYLNKYQVDPAIEEASEPGILNLNTVYDYDPLPRVLSPAEARRILGVQGCLWTEHVQTWSRVQTQLFPRLLALSEVAWSNPARKQYAGFVQRLPDHFEWLEGHRIEFFVAPPSGLAATAAFLRGTHARLQLTNPFGAGSILYTLDHTAPNAGSRVWDGPLEVSEPGTLAAAIVLPNGIMSRTLHSEIHFLDPHEPAFRDPPLALQPGINYAYYTGDFTTLANAVWPKPASMGQLDSVTLIAGRASEHYAMVYSGFIRVEQEDVYTFTLSSDDGSRLYVHDIRVVDNDGVHGRTTASGSIALQPGFHPIRIEYFQGTGGEAFELAVQTNESGVMVPSRVLYRLPSVSSH